MRSAASSTGPAARRTLPLSGSRARSSTSAARVERGRLHRGQLGEGAELVDQSAQRADLLGDDLAGRGQQPAEARVRRRGSSTGSCCMASWIGVSGFLISWASRRATSCQARDLLQVADAIAALGQLDHHLVEGAPEVGQLVAAARRCTRADEIAVRRPRAWPRASAVTRRVSRRASNSPIASAAAHHQHEGQREHRAIDGAQPRVQQAQARPRSPACRRAPRRRRRARAASRRPASTRPARRRQLAVSPSTALAWRKSPSRADFRLRIRGHLAAPAARARRASSSRLQLARQPVGRRMQRRLALGEQLAVGGPRLLQRVAAQLGLAGRHAIRARS